MKKVIYSLSIMIVILCAVILYLIFEKNKQIDVLKTKSKEQHESQINSIINQYKTSNSFIFKSIIDNKDVLLLQKKALDSKSAIEQDKYRKLLYKKLEHFYSHLKEYGIKQLHFHLPDNKSFLRFHKPNKYGDDLSDIRNSIVFVNKNLKAIDGFEEGRIFNGYRFVYPLILEKEHIGSVEVSIGFNAINKISMTNYKIFQYMILNKEVVDGKVFSGERKNYEQSTINENFFHEVNSFLNYKNNSEFQKDIFSLSVFRKINTMLSEKFDTAYFLEYKSKIEFFEFSDLHYYVSLLPIQNIQNENIGYIISYTKCECIRGIYDEFYIKLLLVVLLFLLLILYLYKREMSKIELENLNKIANEQRDKAIKSASVKAEFLANMSHEIRTPLNGILGFVELLSETVTDKKSKEYLKIVNDSSHHLVGIIDDILDFSKIESGKLNLDKHDFLVKKEFEVITHLFEAKASQKNISLHLDISKNVPLSLNSDPLRIKQVISNLVSNAIKFTHKGKNIYITIAYRDNYLDISVKDEGVGIANEKLKHIFEAFNQEDNSTTREYGGTGLGLSISSELVSLLGGTLQVSSKIGKGSEFYFTIPVTIGTLVEKIDSKREKITFENKRILLVEDNKSNQILMSVILKQMNLAFDIANNGEEAVDIFKINKYDLVLMDENMPKMNGLEASKIILDYEKTHTIKHTPIVALTANSLTEDKKRFLDAGMDEYLSKPIDRFELNRVLQKLL
ncbi:hypothetical protein ALC152_19730 [Arcobacter sp. 15-2]|uniref:ATP-binding protein n=1 Tax=Arcobacter sp. 15-2 TaxID=3374109 RepID=UPI00399D185A